MNALVIPPSFQNAPAAVFGGVGGEDDLGAAISAGFAVIGFRGKTWNIKYQGSEKPLLRNDGSGDPLNSIDLVFIKAPNHLSKVWYETGYQEGSNERPDCSASNGEVPDAGVPKRQNDVCISCKWNQFNSKPIQAGQTQAFRGKACQDNKRLAVVPLGDIRNETFGGLMLLKVPPASLNDLQALSTLLKQLGHPYYGAGVKVAFDTTVAYPKFIFKPLRPLTEEEAALSLEMRALPLADLIIHGDPPAPVNPNSQPLHPDNVVTMPKQTNPAADPAKMATPSGFGSGEAPAKPKPAPAASFGNGANQPDTASEKTGVEDFDAALETKLQGLL